MTKTQFASAVKIAESKENLSDVDDSILLGCALPDFAPVYCTVRQFARLLRDFRSWNGEWDAVALNDMAHIARRKINIVD